MNDPFWTGFIKGYKVGGCIGLVLGLFVLLSACGHLSGEILTLRSADPAVSIAFKLLPAPPVPPIEPQILPTITPTPEPECLIKGNVSSSGEKIAHSPGQANYESTQIDPAKGEKCFATLEEAIAAGWRAAQR